MEKLLEKCIAGETMKIWYDACTGKHVRYGVAIAKRLRALGHKITLTTRIHPDTLALAALLKEEFVVVGKYNPKSPLLRLKESLRRQLIFCRMFEKEPPDVAISHRSVELCRVAFGLGIPNISTHDTVHAEAVNRLTMPLIDFLIVSKALPKNSVEGYGIKKIFWFDGVDEVAWIKGFKPEIKYDYEKPLIIVRQLEGKASYAKERSDWTKPLAKKLTSLGNVLFLPRYQKKLEKSLIVPKEFVDSASLVSQADLVISAGGTIAREAALQGVPVIVAKTFEKLYVNDYLAAKGFPIFTVDLSDVFNYAKKLLGKKWDVSALLNELENPVDVVEKIIREEVRR
jgi:predicted glycosyltransferase